MTHRTFWIAALSTDCQRALVGKRERTAGEADPAEKLEHRLNPERPRCKLGAMELDYRGLPELLTGARIRPGSNLANLVDPGRIPRSTALGVGRKSSPRAHRSSAQARIRSMAWELASVAEKAS